MSGGDLGVFDREEVADRVGVVERRRGRAEVMGVCIGGSGSEAEVAAEQREYVQRA